MPVKKATTKKESEVPVPARDVREAGRNVLKKITAEEKKKRQKQYQNEIKDVLGSFLVTSQKPEAAEPLKAKPVQPATASAAKQPAVSLTEEIKKIRQSVLEFLGHEQEEIKPKFAFQKPPLKAEAGKKPEAVKKAVFLVPKFKVAKSRPEPEEPVHQDNLKIEKLAAKAFVPKETVKEKFNRKPLLRSLVFLLVFLLILFTAGIGLGSWQSGLSERLAEFLPYPAVYINGNLVRASVFFHDVDALNKYLNRLGVTITPEQVRRQAMASLVEKEVIKGIAENKGLEVTIAELDGFKTQLLSEEGVDELVRELYGWNLDEYADRVLKPLALAQKVEADYYDSDLLKSLQAQMDGYVAELAEDPGRFEEIASRVNDDSTKFVDGDLGWFSLGDMVPEFEAALLDLEPGSVSQVVETRFGLHLIKLEEKLINDANQTTFHARHIFKQVPPFADYLEEEIKKATVITLIRL